MKKISLNANKIDEIHFFTKNIILYALMEPIYPVSKKIRHPKDNECDHAND